MGILVALGWHFYGNAFDRWTETPGGPSFDYSMHE